MVASGVGRLPLISAQARSSETLSASRRRARSILGSCGRDARSASRQARSNVSSILFVPKATARRSWQPSMTAGQPVPKVSVLTEETAEIAVAETATFMVAPPARPAVRLARELGSPCRKVCRPYVLGGTFPANACRRQSQHMRRRRPLYRALGNLESVREHVWGRDYVRDVPRGDVLDCKTERAGERMAEAPRRSIRKLDFYCADPRGRVAFPSLDLFNLPRFTAAAFFWTRDCVGELLLSGVTIMPALLRRARQEYARGAHEESAKGWSG